MMRRRKKDDDEMMPLTSTCIRSGAGDSLMIDSSSSSISSRTGGKQNNRLIIPGRKEIVVTLSIFVTLLLIVTIVYIKVKTRLGIEIVVEGIDHQQQVLVGKEEESQLYQPHQNESITTPLSVHDKKLAAMAARQEFIIQRRRQRMEQAQHKIDFLMTNYPQSCTDKEPYLRHILYALDNAKLLRQLGMNLDDSGFLNNEEEKRSGKNEKQEEDTLCKMLPTQKHVNAIYGDKAIVYGMDTCSKYRDMLLFMEANKTTVTNNITTANKTIIKPKPRVGGLYHTGTNSLCRNLEMNMPTKLGSNWQTYASSAMQYTTYEVPWGKHLPPAVHRLTNRYPPKNTEDPLLVLPIVLIRDPFYWMQSMCKWSYDAKWDRSDDNRCPNLVRNPKNKSMYEVIALTQQSQFKKQDNYTSLLDMWNDYYTQYLYADYPRLIVRFEDTLYRVKEVVDKIQECIYGSNSKLINNQDNKPFIYHVSTPKSHGKSTDFIKNLQVHATTEKNNRGLNEYDRQYAHETINSELMHIFNYKQKTSSLEEIRL